MARTTTNYGFNISEGTDLVNPLTDIFPNFEDIDTDLKAVSDEAVGNATELLTGTVHALTRADSDRDVIRFTATANFTAGETFTVDGAQVTALTPDGQTLATGSYIIGSEVFAILKGTLLTVFVSPAKAKDADLLDGHDSSYFATSSDLTTLDGAVTNISDKVGTGVLDTTAQNCVGAINELNTNLTDLQIGIANRTGTTGNFGECDLTEISRYHIVDIWSDNNNEICIPYHDSTHWCCQIRDITGQPVANSAYSIHFGYVKK